jgi:membrane protein implicated in regulation of membrane protease activity
MYQVVVFLHVLSVLLFMLLHGVSAIVLMVINRQENPEQVRTLLALRGMVSPAAAVFGLFILVTGVIAASMGDWWRYGWPRISLALFIVIAILMTTFGRRYFDRVSKLLNPAQDSSSQPATGHRLIWQPSFAVRQ